MSRASKSSARCPTTKSSLVHGSKMESFSNRSSNHIVPRLLNRELGLSSYSPSNQLLLRRASTRPAFLLREVVPIEALQQGHVFLGFSRCGQFLLSYTQSSDVEVTAELLTLNYRYRLHWWLFVPYQRARVVSQVDLFTREGVPATLRIAFCEWPRDNSKVAICGWWTGSTVESVHDSRPCYLTITSVPSLNNCRMCREAVSANLDRDNSYNHDSNNNDNHEEIPYSREGMSTSGGCLRHSLTMHTFFELVQPFPSFNPDISLKRDNYVVINSGNILLAFSLSLDKKNTEKTCSNGIKEEEQKRGQRMRENGGDCCSGVGYAGHPSIVWQTRRDIKKDGSRKSGGDISSDPTTARCTKVFELTEDDFVDKRATLNTFPFYRKQKLAEKRYEFREDEENVTTPIQGRGSNNAGDDPTNNESNKQVLRALDENVTASTAEDHQQSQPQQQHSETTSLNRTNSHVRRSRKQPLPRFHSIFITRFVSKDEGSVLDADTGYDFDESIVHSTTSGFHLALPLEVQGACNRPMRAVNNIERVSDASEIGVVCQSSLDLELLSHHVALELCRDAGINCWFFIDFDVMLVDVDNLSGDVLCVAVVLVKPEASITRPSGCQQYETRFKFKWNMDSGQVTIVGVDALKEELSNSKPQSQAVWHPAKAEAAALQRQLCAVNNSQFGVRCLTNDSVIRGRSLRVITDHQMLVAILLDDPGHL